MKGKDVLLWIVTGIMLGVFLPVGIIMVAYIIIKTIYEMFGGKEIERPPTDEELKTHTVLLYDAKYDQNELSDETREKST